MESLSTDSPPQNSERCLFSLVSHPDAFTTKGTSSSIGYLGTIYLADHGPFSQSAHFDPHARTRIMEIEFARLVHEVPIQAARHLALDIPKLASKRGGGGGGGE